MLCVASFNFLRVIYQSRKSEDGVLAQLRAHLLRRPWNNMMDNDKPVIHKLFPFAHVVTSIRYNFFYLPLKRLRAQRRQADALKIFVFGYADPYPFSGIFILFFAVASHIVSCVFGSPTCHQIRKNAPLSVDDNQLDISINVTDKPASMRFIGLF